MKHIFYKPDNAWAADAIPYYEDGVFHLFYLLDYRDIKNHGEGTPWCKVTTKDFVSYLDHGEMLKRGTDKEYDMYVFTGSVFKDKAGKYHIWYTGHNTKMIEGQYIQAVMHAVGDDLDHFVKVPEDTFGNLTEDYEWADWRDPYVWYDQESDLYKMLLSARYKGSPKNRRGETILLTSEDNKKWVVSDKFYAPELYYAHECPDYFKIGEWYYHVFSEFSHYSVTRYVMSKSPYGPWIQPADDMFDGRAFYAAKTVADGKDRYVIGWNPTKEGEVDSGYWQWGGVLEAHKIVQREDGTLACCCPDGVLEAFDNELPVEFIGDDGNPVNRLAFDTGSNAKVVFEKGVHRGVYMVEVEFTYGKGTNRFGVLLNADKENDVSYGYFVEPSHGRFVFEMFPNFPQYKLNAICVERPVKDEADVKHKMVIIVDGTACVAYLDGKYALSSRMYDYESGIVGLMTEGSTEVTSVKIKTIKGDANEN